MSVVLTAPSSKHRAPAVLAAVSVDPSFGKSGLVAQAGSNAATGVAIAPTGVAGAGDIYVAGGDNTHFQVARFTSSGALDTSFGGGIVNTFAGQGAAVTVVPAGVPHAGDVVAGGSSTQGSASGSCGAGVPTPAVAEFTPNGSLDATFGSGGMAIVPCQSAPSLLARDGLLTGVTVDAAGDIDVAGVAYGTSNTGATLVASFSATGAPRWSQVGILGAAVDSVTPAASQASALAFNPSSQDVVVTGSSQVSGQQYLTLAAFNASSGAVDHTFDETGVAQASNQPGSDGLAIVALGNGNLIVSGTVGAHPLLAAYGIAGTPVSSFGSAGQVVNNPAVNGMNSVGGIAYQSSGNVLTTAGSVGTGASQKMVVLQYNATTGAPNRSLGTNGVLTEQVGSFGSWLTSVAAQPDGKVVAAGAAPIVHAVTGIGLLRIMGPTLSVGNLGTIKVTSSSPVTVHFTARLSEALFSNVTVRLCGAPGGVVNVAGQGTCANVVIGAGHTSIPVAVTIKITTTPGHSQTATLTAHTSAGVAADPLHATGSVTIDHLPSPFTFNGYWLVASDGGVFPFHVGFYGSTGGVHLNQPVVGMANTHDGKGYWLVATDGGIFNFGDAKFFGSTGSVHLNKPIVGMAPTPDGKGYWLVASDGGIFNFGDAKFFGSTGSVHLNRPIIAMAATPDGKGYWLVASDGGIFNFGDAGFLGSAGGRTLPAPIVGMGAFPGAPGYWLVGADGSVYNFGAAPPEGSTAGHHLNKPIVAMAPTSDGAGYWLSATDGGIFNFGDAKFFGSTGGVHLNQPIVGMSG